MALSSEACKDQLSLSTPPPPPVYDVLIVGAGASGLSCAHRLSSSSPAVISVLLLEARRRPGGRCFTDETFGDVGGAWLHGTGRTDPRSKNCLFEEGGVKCSRKMDWDNSAVYDERGERVPDAAVDAAYAEWELVERRLEKLQDKGDVDSPLFTGVERAVSELSAAGKLRVLKDDDRLLHLVRSESFDLEYAAFHADASLWWFDQDLVSEGDHVPNGGLGNLLSSAMGFKPTNETSPASELRLGVAVSSICDVPAEGLVRVESDGGTFHCRRCVVTVPLGVLQSGRLSFTPELPATFTNSLKQSGMGLLNKSILIFDEVFWDVDASVLYCLQSPSQPLGWFFNDYKFSGIKRLVYLIGSDDARRSEGRTDDERTQDVMRYLTVMYKEKCRAPVAAHHTRWMSDEWSCGSYSYRRVGFDPNSGFRGFTMPYWDGRLHFAGEHTSKEYTATVHGAVESGRRAAKCILERNCPPTTEGAKKK